MITVKINKADKGVIGALIDLETSSNLSNVIDVMARFSYDEGQRLPHDAAIAAYRDFSLDDLDNLIKGFREQVDLVRNEVAPPPNSGG